MSFMLPLRAPRTLLLLFITSLSLSQSVAGKSMSREDFLGEIQAKGCLNEKELSCLGATKSQCESYMQKIVSDCRDRLPKVLDLSNPDSEQAQSINNFTSCASKLSQSVLGVSPEKAASCAANN